VNSEGLSAVEAELCRPWLRRTCRRFGVSGFAEDSLDGADVEVVVACEFGLGCAGRRVPVDDGVPLAVGEAIGDGLGAVRGAVYEAFDRSDADAMFGGKRLLSDASVEVSC
jgi:hypothetical protein